MSVLVVVVFFLAIGSLFLFWPTSQPSLEIETPAVAEHYIGKVSLNNHISIRLLVLKHCPDNIANTDAKQAIQAANLAASEGLSIKDIGNLHIDREGEAPGVKKVTWGQKVTIDKLQEFISQQMKVDAQLGDTLVIYTIGHGSGSGTVMRLGERSGIMKIFAAAAEENKQETLWWQLSCHAAAGLPGIDTLPDKQQELFSMIASSPASQLSYFCTQGEQMEKVFLAIAKGGEDIDPDQNGVITAKELADFLDAEIAPGRGKLLFARSPDEPIFGWLDVVNLIPIVNPNGQRQEGQEGYVPYPTTRKLKLSP